MQLFGQLKILLLLFRRFDLLLNELLAKYLLSRQRLRKRVVKRHVSGAAHSGVMTVCRAATSWTDRVIPGNRRSGPPGSFDLKSLPNVLFFFIRRCTCRTANRLIGSCLLLYHAAKVGPVVIFVALDRTAYVQIVASVLIVIEELVVVIVQKQIEPLASALRLIATKE